MDSKFDPDFAVTSVLDRLDTVISQNAAIIRHLQTISQLCDRIIDYGVIFQEEKKNERDDLERMLIRYLVRSASREGDAGGRSI